jgi:Tol biopolymer transport system component
MENGPRTGACSSLKWPLLILFALAVATAAARLAPANGGSRIVFFRTKGSCGTIYSMRADGSDIRVLDRGPGDENPSWSPNGEWIAFDSRRAGSWDIYVIGADGKNLRRLTHLEGPAWEPVWSPDGRRIAFVLGIPGTHRDEIYVMNADGSNVRRLTHEAGFFTYSASPAWSPDGKKIAFVSNRGLGTRWRAELYVMDAGGSHVTRLTYDRANARDPAWSPGGRSIIFASDRSGENGIYRMNSDGSGLKLLSDRRCCCPAWSPDGKSIAISCLGASGKTSIYIMNPDGSDARALSEGVHPVFGPGERPDRWGSRNQAKEHAR